MSAVTELDERQLDVSRRVDVVRAWLRAGALSKSEAAVAASLIAEVARDGKDGVISPTMDEIAGWAECSAPTARKAINTLSRGRAMFVGCVGGRGQASRYQINYTRCGQSPVEVRV